MCTASSSRAPERLVARHRRAHERRPDRFEHLRLRALDHRDERKHEFLLHDGRLGRIGVNHRRQQVVRPSRLDEARDVAVLRGDVGDARRLQVGVDRLRNRVGHARDRECRERCVGMFGRQRPNRGQPLRDRVGDLARVTAGPDARAVDAAPPAVDEHALDHHVEMRLPSVDLVVAEQDLREPRAVRLDARIAAVAIDGRLAAEDQAAGEAVEHGGTAVRFARIDRDRFARDAGLGKRRRHAVRRPRLLRSRLQHEPDLHRDDRHPERVDTGRIGRQHQPEHRALRLIADGHAAFLAVAAAEHVEREPARERGQDVPHLAQHERVLLHVRAAHPLGQAGVADCAWTNSSGVCVPSPIGSAAFM